MKIKSTLISVIGAVLLVSCVSSPIDKLASYNPDPSLSPAKVVSIQLEALMHNNSRNDGIELVYRFAAPSNRVQTGPLERFTGLFSAPAYAPMVNSSEFQLMEQRRQGSFVVQTTRVVGADNRERFFLFVLELQKGGVYDNCWMTVAVYPSDQSLPGPQVETQTI